MTRPNVGDGVVPDRLLQELDGGAQTVLAHIQAAGFDDIAYDEALALSKLGPGEVLPADLARDLGITETEASQMIRGLVLRKYIEPRMGRVGSGESRFGVTERGHLVLAAGLTGFKIARWVEFPFRRGDIVISTWPKSGTAWMQMICLLLIFQNPKLPAPLSELSPWLDYNGISRDDVYARLAAQEHRRVIKTHLPLSEIPIDPLATYITVARHPLDSALSLYHQNNNTVGADRPPPRVDQRGPQRRASAREQLLHWINTVDSPRERFKYLAEMLQHLSAAWTRRSEPNVLLVHYEDLSADLEGEMRDIAKRLGIAVPAAIWPDLVRAATFEQMKAAPEWHITQGVTLKDNATFFRKGISGEWRELLSRDEIDRYNACVAKLAPAGLLSWLHRQNGPDKSSL